MCGWPMIVGWLAMLIFALHSSTHMVGAGDTWVAMACGRHFINHGVDTVEPFSANSHKAGPTEEEIATWPGWAQWITDKVGLDTVRYWHPTGWVNQNWLTHVIFYWLTHESPFADAQARSYNAIVYWKFAIYILTVICIYYTARVMGVNCALAAVFACFAMFIGRTFFDIRPAGFSNLLAAAFLLVLVLSTYRNILYIWLIVPITVFWCNVHGGYLYLFIMLALFVFFHFLTSFSKKCFVSIGLKGVYHTVGAGFVAFLAMIIFNPFHLTNLTHTFVISLSEHAKLWRTVNEWHPAFEWRNPVGDEIPFLIMYIICWIVLVAWSIVYFVTYRSAAAKTTKKKKYNDNEYNRPKIDLAFLFIAALTIYMAIRSRRFIPLAGFAACPVVALFINQIIRSVSATVNFHKNKSLVTPPIPAKIQFVFTLTGVVAILFFGTLWGYKFKRVYLDPWPTDSKLNSICMRMTASDAKPFYVMDFIRENNFSGRMFNYWTEGGFIAYGQKPDPNTGKTPLQLFMDGRAQAAYEPAKYKLWSNIMAGGPEVRNAKIRGKTVNYKQVGKWIEKQLRKYDVWLTLMPAAQSNSPFVKGLERNPDWPIVFLNNRMKLFVDAKSEKGKKVFDDMQRNKLRYPDEYTRALTLAHNLLIYGPKIEAKKQAFGFAINALRSGPEQIPMQKITYCARFSELSATVYKVCNDYVNDLTQNKKVYRKQAGYHNKLAAGLIASNYLRKLAEMRKNSEDLVFYSEKLKEFEAERRLILQYKRW